MPLSEVPGGAVVALAPRGEVLTKVYRVVLPEVFDGPVMCRLLRGGDGVLLADRTTARPRASSAAARLWNQHAQRRLPGTVAPPSATGTT